MLTLMSNFVVSSMACCLIFFRFFCVAILAGKPGFTKKQADLFFPPDFADDFPVAMQVEYRFQLLVCLQPHELHSLDDSSFLVSSFN